MQFVVTDSTNWEIQHEKIVNGQSVNISEYPYHVFMLIGQFACGGSIITDLLILTAAHCFTEDKNAKKIIRVGSSEMRKGGQVIIIDEVFTHPYYSDFGGNNYDLAIALLCKKIIFNEFTKPIRIQYDEIAVGKWADVTGFGDTSAGGELSDTLQHISLPILSNKECQKYYKSKYEKITNEMFCAGFIDGKGDSCQGDSGGPVALKGKLIGVVSWGKGCAEIGFPGVYTRLSKMREFIEKIIKKFSKKRTYSRN